MGNHSKKTSFPGYTELYKASGLSSVQLLNVLSLSFAAASCGLAYMLVQARGEAAPSLTERVAWAALVLTIAFGFLAGVWIYERRIATRLLISSDGQRLRVVQPTPFGATERDISLADIAGTFHEPGDPAGEEALVNSRLLVEVRNQRPFIIPFGGKTADRDKLLNALSPRTS